MLTQEPLDGYLDSQEEDEEETCPQCGENIEYIKQLDWGHLYCTRCNWTERI